MKFKIKNKFFEDIFFFLRKEKGFNLLINLFVSKKSNNNKLVDKISSSNFN
jgi:hypothetical protein